MHFRILGPIEDITMIATGGAIRERRRLWRLYGRGWWRKLKGKAQVELANGSVRTVEVHWYEADGIGRREFKIKRFLDANN